jgi:TM2 domain-containing membrane protein YozV
MRAKRLFTFFITILLLLVSAASYSQQRDSVTKVLDTAKTAVKKNGADTGTAKKKRSEAGKAAIRSAIIPGWGQIYNKKYWKLPIVYGVLAIPVVTFSYNKTWYDKTREAYNIRYYNDTSQVSDLPTDGIDPTLKPLSTESLRLYRNEFRQNVDFSVLAFLIIWGLQVADAAVDAHLKSFNVSDDLSLKIKPMFSPGRSAGLGLVVTFRDDKPKSNYIKL